MKFKVGDRLQIIPGDIPGFYDAFPGNGGQIGTVVEIEYAPEYRCWYYKLDGVCIGPGLRGFTCEQGLRRVPPDREQTVPWSECYFQPRDLKVTV